MQNYATLPRLPSVDWRTTVYETCRRLNDRPLVTTIVTDCLTWPPNHEDAYVSMSLGVTHPELIALDSFTIVADSTRAMSVFSYLRSFKFR